MGSRRILFWLLTSFVGMGVLAQPNCEDALIEAKRMYEAGNFEQCMLRLESCLGSTHDRDIRLDSYRLLTKSALNLQDGQKAEKYLDKLLHLEPDYQRLGNVDPIEFVRFLNRYRVEPRLLLGFSVGASLTGVQVLESWLEHRSSQTYFVRPGFQGKLSACYMLNRQFFVGLGAQASGNTVHHEVDEVGVHTSDPQFSELYRQRYSEHMNFMGLSISAGYRLNLTNALKLQTELGGGGNRMLKSSSFFQAENLKTGTVQEYSADVTSYRFRNQPFVLGTFGLYRSLRRGEIGIQLMYQHYLKNIIDPDQRLADLDFNIQTQYVNDDISLRVTSILLSYQIPLMNSIRKLHE